METCGAIKRARGAFLQGNVHVSCLHGGGEDDLGDGSAKLLKRTEKRLQLRSGSESYFDELRELTGNIGTLQNVGAAFDKGIKSEKDFPYRRTVLLISLN